MAEDIEHDLRRDREIEDLVDKEPQRKEMLQETQKELLKDHQSMRDVSHISLSLGKITIAVIANKRTKIAISLLFNFYFRSKIS